MIKQSIENKKTKRKKIKDGINILKTISFYKIGKEKVIKNNKNK